MTFVAPCRTSVMLTTFTRALQNASHSPRRGDASCWGWHLLQQSHALQVGAQLGPLLIRDRTERCADGTASHAQQLAPGFDEGGRRRAIARPAGGQPLVVDLSETAQLPGD